MRNMFGHWKLSLKQKGAVRLCDTNVLMIHNKKGLDPRISVKGVPLVHTDEFTSVHPSTPLQIETCSQPLAVMFHAVDDPYIRPSCEAAVSCAYVCIQLFKAVENLNKFFSLIHIFREGLGPLPPPPPLNHHSTVVRQHAVSTALVIMWLLFVLHCFAIKSPKPPVCYTPM